jgi:putative transposase
LEDVYGLKVPLSFGDVEEMLTERGIDVSYETIRRWISKFGPAIAANVRSRRVQPSGTWHLDEVFVRIGGKRTYL